MNELVREWVGKADADYYTAGRELDVQEQANFDAVCFHCQQCAEKLIKALLTATGKVPPRIHDLAALADLAKQVMPEFDWPAEELRFVTRAAVAFRYPGESADHEEARESFRIATALRTYLTGMIEDQP